LCSRITKAASQSSNTGDNNRFFRSEAKTPALSYAKRSPAFRGGAKRRGGRLKKQRHEAKRRARFGNPRTCPEQLSKESASKKLCVLCDFVVKNPCPSVLIRGSFFFVSFATFRAKTGLFFQNFPKFRHFSLTFLLVLDCFAIAMLFFRNIFIFGCPPILPELPILVNLGYRKMRSRAVFIPDFVLSSICGLAPGV
jgi:hypothetical protein